MEERKKHYENIQICTNLHTTALKICSNWMISSRNSLWSLQPSSLGFYGELIKFRGELSSNISLILFLCLFLTSLVHFLWIQLLPSPIGAWLVYAIGLTFGQYKRLTDIHYFCIISYSIDFDFFFTTFFWYARNNAMDRCWCQWLLVSHYTHCSMNTEYAFNAYTHIRHEKRTSLDTANDT